MSDEEREKLPSFATVPPPNGAIDEHSAPTTVAELPDSFLAELKSAAKHEVKLHTTARDDQDSTATTRNHAFDLELREKLRAQLVDVEPPAASAVEGAPLVPLVVVAPSEPPPAEPPSPEPSSPAGDVADAGADAALSAARAAESIAPARPQVDAGKVFLVTLAAILGCAAIAWVYVAYLQ
jgi:hypothetical protein